MTIRRLPEGLVNRIAAGEVVERPASAVKELVENAIDAGASRIEVVMRDGGRTLASVTDDGRGMTREELPLAVARHATSKLPGEDLTRIVSLGFRGEALPSIGSVCRMTITSRARGADAAWSLALEGGRVGEPTPAAHPPGTRVELRDLFYATPARLKFLKAERTELGHAIDAVNRLAMAHPGIAFALSDGQRAPIRLSAAQGELFDARASRAWAPSWGVSSPRTPSRSAPSARGCASPAMPGSPPSTAPIPRPSTCSSMAGRCGTGLLHGAVRGAYQDFLSRHRHPMVALFLDCPPDAVDVNVHPTKAEVRFSDTGLVRGLIVGALRHALAEAGHRASTTVSAAALGAMRPGTGASLPYAQAPARVPRGLAEQAAAFQGPTPFGGLGGPSAAPGAGSDGRAGGSENPLGAARAQVHETYIVAPDSGRHRHRRPARGPMSAWCTSV